MRQYWMKRLADTLRWNSIYPMPWDRETLARIHAKIRALDSLGVQ